MNKLYPAFTPAKPAYSFRLKQLLMLCFALLLSINYIHAADTPGNQQRSLGEVLNADGTIKPGTGGSFDARGLTLSTGKNGQPIFSTPAQTGDGIWGNKVSLSWPNFTLSAIAINGNDIYVGGDFSTAGNHSARLIARWDGMAWSALGTEMNDLTAVSAIAISDNDIYVGGRFTPPLSKQATYFLSFAGRTVQEITFPAIIDKTYGDEDFSPGAVSDARLEIAYSSNNADVAIIVDGKVRIVGAGTATITASQPGNETYAAAEVKTQALTVNKASQITLPVILGKHLKSEDFELNDTINGLPLSYVSNNNSVVEVYQDVADNNKWKVVVKGVGTAEIVVFQPGNDNYEETRDTIRFPVNFEEQPVHSLWSTGDTVQYFHHTLSRYTFGEVLPEIKPELPGVYSVEIEVIADGYWPLQDGFVYGMASYPVINTSFHELGRYAEEWGYRGRNGNLFFGDRETAFGGKTINDIGDRVILQYDTETTALHVYVKQKGENEYTLMGGKAAFNNVVSGEGRKLHFVVAGICLKACGVKIVSSSIPKKSQEITFPALADKVYGDADFSPGAVSDAGLEIAYSSNNTDVATIVDGKIRIVGAGTATITASQPGNETYAAAEVKTQVLTVDKKDLTITAENKTMQEGQALPTFTASYNGLVESEDESVLTANLIFNTIATSESAPGIYDIEVSGASSDNYNISYQKGILTIEEGLLPVNLIAFTIIAEANQAKLFWQSASESNNKEYIVSRSTDGIQFIELGRIAGKGNSNSVTAYSYSDKNPLNGNNYYKLVQVDNDGKVSELGIRTVSFSLSAFGLQLYPNPTDDIVNVVFETGKYKSITVADVNGKVLQQVQISSDENNLAVSLGNYPAGTYLLSLSGSGGIETGKVVRK